MINLRFLKLSQLAGVLTGGALAVALLVAPATAGTDEANKCGGGKNPVDSEFSLPSGAALWKAFPALGIAPDILEDPNPLYVVVFAGDYDLDGVVAADHPAIVTNVVCVVQSNGIPILFTGVSKAGALVP